MKRVLLHNINIINFMKRENQKMNFEKIGPSSIDIIANLGKFSKKLKKGG